MRCSKSYPCYNCSRFSRNCVLLAFQKTNTNSISQTSQDENARLFFPQAFNILEPEYVDAEGGASHDAMFDADAEDDLMDFGLQIGRLIISERYKAA